MELYIIKRSELWDVVIQVKRIGNIVTYFYIETFSFDTQYLFEKVLTYTKSDFNKLGICLDP